MAANAILPPTLPALIHEYSRNASRRDGDPVVSAEANAPSALRFPRQPGSWPDARELTLAAVANHELRRMGETPLDSQSVQKFLEQQHLQPVGIGRDGMNL